MITDVGSAKRDTISKINRIKRKDINWISSHPIAGSEVSGPLNGNENLFLNKWSVIIKQKDSQNKEMKKNYLHLTLLRQLIFLSKKSE